MKYPLFLFLFLFLSFSSFSQDRKEAVLYLIGDTGKDTVASGAVRYIASHAIKDTGSSVIFLGDNIYFEGLYYDKDSALNVTQKKMLCQLELFKNYQGSVFMVPGNHDWKAGKWQGKKRIEMQEKFVNSTLAQYHLRNKISEFYFPGKALPGPASTKVSEKVRLIFIDTQWFLQKQFFHPVGKLPGKSQRQTEKEFWSRLDSLLKLAARNNETVIIAGHHPLFTNGRHGSKREPYRSLVNYTPLQLFGILSLNRLFVQDTQQPRYKRFSRKMSQMLEGHHNTIWYVAGHDHNMQFSHPGNFYHIISGAGSSVSKKVKKKDLLFLNKKQPGFFKLTVYSSGKVMVEAFGEYEGKLFEGMY